MKIGELATLTRTQVETIRYYEREGLLPAAPRSDGNYRIYGPEHAERLAFIRQCRALSILCAALAYRCSSRDCYARKPGSRITGPWMSLRP